MRVYLVFELDLSGLGDFHAPYSRIDYACEGAKQMLDTVLLYDGIGNDRKILTYDQVEILLEDSTSLAVYGEIGNQGLIMWGEMDKNVAE